MGIAPIDLQTLFTQLDKVGRAQSMREGQAIQQAVQGIQIQKKAEEQVQQVNETQNTGEGGVENINDRRRGQKGGAKKENSGKNDGDEEDENEEEENQPFMLRDPNLGKRIDISL